MRAARSKALAPNWPTFAPPQWPNFTPPLTALRLRKIAYHIAGLAKNFKKMQSRGYEDAISDWEDDLKYMHDKYYVRHFGFSWPGRGL